MLVHHIGYVVPSVADKAEELKSKFNKNLLVSETIVDPLQKVKIILLESENLFIELIEPLNESSPVFNALSNRGSHLNHLCLEVENIQETIKLLTIGKDRWLLVSPISPAVAFNGRNVAFLMSRDNVVWELLESEKI